MTDEADLHDRAATLILNEDWSGLERLAEEYAADGIDAPTRASALSYMAESRLRRGDVGSALGAARLAEETFETAAATLFVAQLHLKRGELQTAALKAQRAVFLAGSHAGILHQAWGALAVVALREGRVGVAISAAETAVRSALSDHRFLQVMSVDLETLTNLLQDARTHSAARRLAAELELGLRATRRYEDAAEIRDLLRR